MCDVASWERKKVQYRAARSRQDRTFNAGRTSNAGRSMQVRTFIAGQGRTFNAEPYVHSRAGPYVQCRAVRSRQDRTFNAGRTSNAGRSMQVRTFIAGQGRTFNAEPYVHSRAGPYVQCRAVRSMQGERSKQGRAVRSMQGRTFHAVPCVQCKVVRSMQGRTFSARSYVAQAIYVQTLCCSRARRVHYLLCILDKTAHHAPQGMERCGPNGGCRSFVVHDLQLRSGRARRSSRSLSLVIGHPRFNFNGRSRTNVRGDLQPRSAHWLAPAKIGRIRAAIPSQGPDDTEERASLEAALARAEHFASIPPAFRSRIRQDRRSRKAETNLRAGIDTVGERSDWFPTRVRDAGQWFRCSDRSCVVLWRSHPRREPLVPVRNVVPRLVGGTVATSLVETVLLCQSDLITVGVQHSVDVPFVSNSFPVGTRGARAHLAGS